MINITKEYEFDMAHRLENFEGLCKNIHGHTYRLLVTFCRKSERMCKDKGHIEGMVEDFGMIKELVKINIINKMDHAFAYNTKDKDSLEIAEYLKKKINQKTFGLDFRLTAEAMSKWIYRKINNVIDSTHYQIKCIKVVLYETPTSCAEYTECE